MIGAGESSREPDKGAGTYVSDDQATTGAGMNQEAHSTNKDDVDARWRIALRKKDCLRFTSFWTVEREQIFLRFDGQGVEKLARHGELRTTTGQLVA